MASRATVVSPKPFYSEDGIQIYHTDCYEFLRQFPTESIDIIITDPPYGIKADKSASKDGGKLKGQKTGFAIAAKTEYKLTDWDKAKPDARYFYEMLRVSKNQIIFGGNYFIEHLYPTPCWIVWDKDNNGNFADCELAWTSFGTAVRKFKWRWNGMLQEDMKNKEERIHPTQKPLALMKWIIKNYTKETDVILDPFMGSGTTLQAAYELGRSAIGVETHKPYCKQGVERLKQTVLPLTV